MSNLQLPTLTFAALSERLTPGRSTKIIYATTAYLVSDRSSIVIRYHDNLIAEITADTLWLSNAGWDSVTTAHRLDAILTAFIGAHDKWRIRIKDRAICLYSGGGNTRCASFHQLGGSVEFKRVGDYVLTDPKHDTVLFAGVTQ